MLFLKIKIIRVRPNQGVRTLEIMACGTLKADFGDQNRVLLMRQLLINGVRAQSCLILETIGI